MDSSSSSERLPEDGERVLTWWDDKKLIQLQMYQHCGPAGISWWRNGWQSLIVADGDVTHWMLLPESLPSTTIWQKIANVVFGWLNSLI